MEGQASGWQEVSGPSVFWILLTLSIAAATLPSTRSKILGPSINVGTNIDPLRSMPWVCFLDAIFDLIIIARTIHYHMSKREEKDGQREEQTAHGEPNLIMVKLVMTLLAVLPQTVKILSMRGIPVSQICACVFFFAIATSLIMDLWMPPAEEPCPGRKVYIAEKTIKAIMTCLGLLIWTGMFISELWIWYNIARFSSFEPSPNVKNLNSWMVLACDLGLLIQLVVSVIYFCISSHRFAISKYPRIVPLVGIFGFFVTLKGIAESPIEERSSTGHITPVPLWLKRAIYSMSLMCCAAIVSTLTAVLIHALGMLIARKRDTVQQPSGQDVESGTDQAASTAQSSESERPQEKDGNDGSQVRRVISSVMSGIRCLPTIGRRIDHWLWNLFTLPSVLSFFASLTIFNLIRTVLYYLVVFDGRGTSSPTWNSLLG